MGKINIKTLTSFIFIISFPVMCFGNGLIKLKVSSSEYYIIPVESIQSINVESQDEEIEFSIAGHGVTLWRAEVENISEKDARELIYKIYDQNRKKIITIDVSGTN